MRIGNLSAQRAPAVYLLNALERSCKDGRLANSQLCTPLKTFYVEEVAATADQWVGTVTVDIQTSQTFDPVLHHDRLLKHALVRVRFWNRTVPHVLQTGHLPLAAQKVIGPFFERPPTLLGDAFKFADDLWGVYAVGRRVAIEALVKSLKADEFPFPSS